jgi:predicted N-acyltransferase
MKKNEWQVSYHQNIEEIDESEWQRLFRTCYPFTRYGFLQALESSGSVSQQTGWQPQHVIVRRNGRTVAAMPCYIKRHSYGEYVFDWGWADAYQRHGLVYYPKLLTAIPFTPAVGPRLGVAEGENTDAVLNFLLSDINRFAQSQNCSSWHLLFPLPALSDQIESLSSQFPLLRREGTQFHWFNRDYHHFGDFLALLTSRKRKNLRKERAIVAAAGFTFCWLQGQSISHQDIDTFYPFYAATYLKRGQQPYLTPAFFQALPAIMADQVLLLLVRLQGKVVAASLFFQDTTTLYGRYWGCLEEYLFLHFETCYYRGIEYCIENKLQRFDAGAQGEHKLLRGFEPVPTTSWHWVEHAGFRDAIARFLEEERNGVTAYRQEALSCLPFRSRDN